MIGVDNCQSKLEVVVRDDTSTVALTVDVSFVWQFRERWSLHQYILEIGLVLGSVSGRIAHRQSLNVHK